jgi:hypothetical protein
LESKEKNEEKQGKLSTRNHPSECTLRWTKNGTCGIHNFPFSQFLVQKCDVLGMQISAFESREQEEYLNPIVTSFQIMTNVPI